MHKTARWVVVAGAALAGLLVDPASVQAKPSIEVPAGWYTDYAAARAKAKETGKPIFVHFR
jgi:hypothetical protein